MTADSCQQAAVPIPIPTVEKYNPRTNSKNAPIKSTQPFKKQ